MGYVPVSFVGGGAWTTGVVSHGVGIHVCTVVMNDGGGNGVAPGVRCYTLCIGGGIY